MFNLGMLSYIRTIFTWTTTNLTLPTNQNNIISNGTTYCAVLAQNTPIPTVYTSPDGVTWTSRSLPAASAWFGGFGKAGLLCFVGGGGGTNSLPFYVQSVNNGVNWTFTALPTIPFASTYHEIAVNNAGLRIALYYNFASYVTSTDGINWITRGFPIINGVRRIATDGTKFCVLTNLNNTTYTTSDGFTWTAGSLPGGATGTFNHICYNGTVFAAVDSTGNRVFTSLDGLTWNQYALPSTSTWFSVTANSLGHLIAYTSTPNVKYAESTDNGRTWTEYVAPYVGVSSASVGVDTVILSGTTTAYKVTPV